MPSPLLVTTSISTALTMGLIPQLLRGLQAPLRERLQLSESRLDQLNKLLILAWVPLMPLAGWLVDHWGLQAVLFTGSLTLGLAVAWLALCENVSGLLWAIVGLAIAGACISTAGVSLMPAALTVASGQGRMAVGRSVGASLCLGYVFVGLASLAGPTVILWLLRKLDFRRSGLILGLLCLVPALLATLVTQELPVAEPLAPGEAYDVRFWLVALVAFLWVPLELALEIWPRSYLREIGYTSQAVLRLVVGFWCAFLLFRFGLGWIIRPGYEAWLVLVLLLVSSMVMGNLVGAYASSSGAIGFWLVGAFYGSILPALLGTLAVTGTRHIPGQTVGAVFGFSALAFVVTQPLLAAYAKRHGPREIMRLAILLGLLMAAPVLVLALIRFWR